MPSNRRGSTYERSSSFTSSFALIAFTSTLTLLLAHLAARQPQPILQQPPLQQAPPLPSIHPAQPAQPPPSAPLPPPPAPPAAAPVTPPLSHAIPPLQQPTLIWLGNNGSGILYALLVLVLLFGLSGVWLERIAPPSTNTCDRIADVEVEVHEGKKKMMQPSNDDELEEAKFPGRWMNRMEAKIDRMQRKVNKERRQRKSKKEDDSDSSSSSTSASSYEDSRRKTYCYRRSSSTRYEDRSCIDHGARLHKRRDSYCCDHCGTIVAVCAGSGATLDAPPPPIPVMASNAPSETDEVTKIKIESTSTISKEEIEKTVNQEVERRLREYEKRLEEEILKRLKREQEEAKTEEKEDKKKNGKKDDESKDKWNEAWENDGWEKTEEKVTTKIETKVEKKDQASSSSSTSVTTSKGEDENPNIDKPSEKSEKVDKEKVEIKFTVKEKENEKDKSNESQPLLGILKKTPSLESDNDKDDDERDGGQISQKLHGFREDIRDWIGDLKDDAKETVQDVGDFAQEIKDEAKEKAGDVKGKAKEIVHNVTHLGSDSSSDEDKGKKEADSNDNTSQSVQLTQDSVKERIVTKITHKDEIELKAARGGSKNVTFADPIQTEQEIPAIALKISDKGKGKAREVDDEERPSTYSFAEAPIPMPDIVSPYEIDGDRFMGVKSSVSSTSSSSGTSTGSGKKNVKEKTRVSISTNEQGNKVISTEKVTTTKNSEDDDEKESQNSEAYRESDFTETIFGIVDKIVDGISGKKSKGKSKKVDKDDAEVKIDVSVTTETTPKVEDENDSKDADDDQKGKDVVEESSESTVKETTKTKTSEDVKATTSEIKGKDKEDVVIVGKADVGQPAFTAEELYLETAKYLSDKYPELVAKETVRVNSSLDQTYEEGKANIKEKTTSDADDQAHQDGDEPTQVETVATTAQHDSTSATNIEEITTKAQDGSNTGDMKSNSGEEAMMRALGTIRQYGSGSSYSNLESKYYGSYFRPKVERSADDVLLSLINSLFNQPKESNHKTIKFSASALQGTSKISEKMKMVNIKEKEESKEDQVEENGSDEKQQSSSSKFPEKISADAIKAASIATADQIRRHQAQLRPQEESFFTFLKKDTARSFEEMKDDMKGASSKLGKFTGTLKRKVSKGSLKRSPSPGAERSSASIDAPDRFDASQVINFKGQGSKSKESAKKKSSPTPYGIPLKEDTSDPPPTPYGLNFNKPPLKKPLVQFDRKVNVLEFHDPSTSSSSGSSSTTKTKQQIPNKLTMKDTVEKAKEVEDVYTRISKLTRRLSEK